MAAKQPSTAKPTPAHTRQFRWQSLFQRVSQPLFVLDRKRRILFVNHAWEQLTGVASLDARGLACTRRATDSAQRPGIVARSLWPPLEALRGETARARRRIPDMATGWWDVEFLPLAGPDGLLCILGRITGPPLPPIAGFTPFHEALSKLRDQLAEGLTAQKAAKFWSVENLVDVRQRHARRFRLELLDSPLPAMHRVLDQARLATGIAGGVYIVGESGIGKTWLARAIHQSSPIREQAFVCLDCARLPTIAISDALFGSVGMLWRPGIGTVYLKDPSRLTHDLQLRIHEWLENAAKDHGIPGPHVIAGSVAAPLAEVQSGQLLEKLHTTLTTLVIELPPLRQRMADLADLIDRLLDRHNEVNERQVTGLTAAAWEMLREYHWPGNLRELNAALAAACARASSELIDVLDLPSSLRQAVTLNQSSKPGPEKPIPLDSILQQVERRLIGLALRRARGNRTRAAEILGVWRPRLLRRMEALEIEAGTEDRGQRTEDRGRRTEDRGQRTEDGGQRTEDGGQRTEDTEKESQGSADT